MVHMKVFTGPYSAPHSFFLFFPPFCMSCHLEGCVSSVVLASWRKDPSSSCSGERDYSNPTPLVRLTIIIIIISPKRSIICSDAAGCGIERPPDESDSILLWSLLLILSPRVAEGEKNKVVVIGCVAAASQ